MMDTPLNLTRPEGAEPEDFHVSRRGIAGLFFFGYALAVSPVNAETITTPDAGLFTKNLTIPPLHDEGGYQIPAYVAMPATPGTHKVIIVVNEIFGLHDWIRDICRRFAHQGYCAVALDFFARKGNAAAISDFPALMALVSQAGYPQVMGDIQAALNWLKSEPKIGQPGDKPFADMDHVGITGFCWGGTPVWMAAATLPEIKAGVAFYGRLEKSDNSGENRPWPIDIASSLTRPVLGFYADGDKGIGADSVARMNAALKASGKTPSHLVVMPNTQHGFMADYRPSYNADAAKQAWTQTLDWFGKYL
ncbi:MAG: dienelactone hydrolase family protein [Asticcacaulis sp.]